MRLKFKPVISPVILLALSACFLSCHKKDKEGPTPAPPVRVSIMTVANDSDKISTEYSGTVVAAETTTVSFAVAGKIKSLSVKEGDKVSKGQVLGKIDAGDYENARNIAYAQLAEAQDGYNRLKKLHDANALPAVKWVEMEQKLKQAQNAAEMADRTLNDAVLRSPVSGTISEKMADVGQSILPVQPIYEIVSTDDLQVEVTLTENEISAYNSGDTALVSFNVEGQEKLKGKIISKSVVADPLTRGYTVKISLPATKSKLLPGMLANVVFEETSKVKDKSPTGIILPSGTVMLNNDNTRFVWVVKNNKAQRRTVMVDELVATGILVTSGLNPGDTVIISGMQKVGTGSSLEIVDR